MSIFEFAIDVDADGDYDDAVEDISTYVMAASNVTCSRGKDAAKSFASPAAGTYNAELLNVSQIFSPGNISSPYYGIKMAGKRVRWLLAGGEGGTLDIGGGDLLIEGGGSLLLTGTPKRVIFTARMLRFLQHAEKERRTVEMPSLSMLSRLVGKNVTTQVYQNITTSDAIAVILALAGWPADERIISTGQTVLAWWWWHPSMGDAFQAIVALLLSEGPGASIYDNPDGFFVSEDRDYRTTNSRSTMIQTTYSDLDSRIVPPFDYDENEQNIIEACAVTVEEREVQPVAPIWSLGSDLTLGPNEVWKRRFTTSDLFINALHPDSLAVNTIFTLTGSQPLTAGNFKLEYLGVQTSSLAYNLTAGAAETALEDLYGAGNVSCSGGPLNVAPIFCELINDYATLNITTFPTVVDSTLNPVNIPGGITVEEIFPGGSGFQERQRLTASGILTAGTFTIDVTFSLGTFMTSSIAYNASASTIAVAIAAITGLSSTTAHGGPVNTDPVDVNFVDITSENIDNVVITGTGLMMQTPGATVDIAVSQPGGVADYRVLTGTLHQIILTPLSGVTSLLTVVAGSGGVSLTGLRVRGQLVTVARTFEVFYPDDVEERIADGEDIKVFRPQVLSGVSRETAEIIAMLYVLYYSEPRPTIRLTIKNSIYKETMDTELQREVSDRIRVQIAQLGLNADFFVEQIEHSLVGTELYTTLGCEMVMAA